MREEYPLQDDNVIISDQHAGDSKEITENSNQIKEILNDGDDIKKQISKDDAVDVKMDISTEQGLGMSRDQNILDLLNKYKKTDWIIIRFILKEI